MYISPVTSYYKIGILLKDILSIPGIKLLRFDALLSRPIYQTTEFLI